MSKEPITFLCKTAFVLATCHKSIYISRLAVCTSEPNSRFANFLMVNPVRFLTITVAVSIKKKKRIKDFSYKNRMSLTSSLNIRYLTYARECQQQMTYTFCHQKRKGKNAHFLNTADGLPHQEHL